MIGRGVINFMEQGKSRQLEQVKQDAAEGSCATDVSTPLMYPCKAASAALGKPVTAGTTRSSKSLPCFFKPQLNWTKIIEEKIAEQDKCEHDFHYQWSRLKYSRGYKCKKCDLFKPDLPMLR